MTKRVHSANQATVSARSLLSHAYQYLRALRILAAAGASAPLTVMGHLAAHALELTLKGYLLSSGMEERDFVGPGKIGHDLEAAWRECEAMGLILVAEKSWMMLLNLQHNRPHLYRYGRDGWGQSIPGDPASLAEYIERLMRQVFEALNETLPK